MIRVLVAAQLEPVALADLRRRYDVAHLEHGRPSPAAVADVDVLVMRGHFTADADLLRAAKRLRLIVKAGAGLDNIDLAEAAARDVKVVSTPASAPSVAELAILLLLAVRRNLRGLDSAVRQDRWAAKYECIGREVTGSRLGLVGFGAIGQEVARLGRGLGAEVIACDRSPDRPDKQAAAGRWGVRFADLGTVMACDAVSLHAPLTAANRTLIGARELACAPAHGVLINTARAGLVDTPALVAALTEGRLAGAGLDVFDQEPVPVAAALLSLPTVTVTPHIGAQTAETQGRIGRQVVEHIAAFAQDSRPLRPLMLEEPS